jgi:hypothetical protein
MEIFVADVITSDAFISDKVLGEQFNMEEIPSVQRSSTDDLPRDMMRKEREGGGKEWVNTSESLILIVLLIRTFDT